MKKIIILIITCSFLAGRLYAQWTELGTGANALNANSIINSITSDSSGNIYAGGYFSNGASYTEGKRYVAKWNGSSWEQLIAETYAGGTAQYITNVITGSAGNLYAAAQLQYGSYVIKWDGSSWSELGSGVNSLNNGLIGAIAADNAGNIYAVGEQGVNDRKYIAKWDGITWSDLGSSYTKLNAYGSITKVITDPSRNVYAIVDTTLGRGVFQKIYKFNGIDWVEFGTGVNGTHNKNWTIHNIAVDMSENIYAAVSFDNGPPLYENGTYIAKWNGANWLQLGAPGEINFFEIYSLIVDKYGKVYAAGLSLTDNNDQNRNYVAVYDGSTWKPLCAGNNCLDANATIKDITSDAEGNIYAGGDFTDGNGKRYVAKFSPGGPLPLKLLAFTVALQNANTAKVQWQIATPEDGNKYELQRSSDGRAFLSIAIQKNGSLTSFSYADNSLSNGTYYYRLKITDKDGKIIYSNIAIIKVGSKEQMISAYPNPVKRGESLQLSLQNIKAGQIEIINAAGQVMYTNSSKTTGSISIPVSASFATGIYLLRVISENKVTTQKISIR
ncbi:MAG: T9SS type A sorting domain-containing protein [Ferruginibacter sp.]